MTAPVTVLFGKRVRAIRRARNWTLRELEDKSGVSREVISRAELGRHDVSFSRAVAIADALELSLDALTAPPSCQFCDGMPGRGQTCRCGRTGPEVAL
jgi:transcriptional regulator with XRE-family HTH domain